MAHRQSMLVVSAVLCLLAGVSELSGAPDAKPRAPSRGERKKGMASMLGTERASFGPLLQGLVIGESPPESVKKRLTALGFEIESNGFPGSVRITIASQPAQQTCDDLWELLKATWGPPVDVNYFLNPKLGQRARFLGCELVFDHYQPVEAFVNLSPTSNFPLFLLGKTRDKVDAEIKRQGGDRTLWALPAIDTSIGDIEVFAELEQGKVVSLKAKLVDNSVLPALRAQLDKLFGKATVAATAPQLRWNGTPPVSIDTTYDILSIVAGKQPR